MLIYAFCVEFMRILFYFYTYCAFVGYLCFCII